MAGDPCRTLGQPTAPVAAAGSSGLFNGTVYGYITYLNQWGETIPSTEVGPVNCTNQTVNLSAMVTPYGVTSARFYYGYASGAEYQYITFTPGTTATVGAITDQPVSGAAPYQSSAYLPDTDGDIVSAGEMYRWINAGLVELGRLVGGILDQGGAAMQAGAAEVAIPGWWLKIQYVWHDGWLTLPENQSYTWLQSPVQGIPGISTLWHNAAQQVLGTWPQPSTAPASTYLSTAMGASDTVANVEATNTFVGTGSMPLNSFILTSPTGGFASSMVGLAVTVQGAGLGGTPLVTAVANIISSTQVTLEAPALTAVSGVSFTVSSGQNNSQSPEIGFTAPGMCQIDDEIMSYSQGYGTQLTQIVRGYAGTIATSHAQGALVIQLIFRFLGRRMPSPVALGQSTYTLDLPQGWDAIMDYYILSRFKQTEQNVQESKLLLDTFVSRAIELRDDQIPLSSKQMGGLWPLGGAAQSLADIMDTVIVN